MSNITLDEATMPEFKEIGTLFQYIEDVEQARHHAKQASSELADKHGVCQNIRSLTDEDIDTRSLQLIITAVVKCIVEHTNISHDSAVLALQRSMKTFKE